MVFNSATGSGTGSTQIWGTWVTNNDVTCGSSATWNNWVGNSVTINSGTLTWKIWTGDTGTGSAVSDNVTTWQFWVNGTVSAEDVTRLNAIPAETQEAREARLAREEQARIETERHRAAYLAQQEKLAKERAEANAKAEKLLLENLPPEEAERYKKDGFFYVWSQSNKRYKIKRGTHGNVYLVDEGGIEKVRYCVQPEGVPTGDANLAQALFLKHAEEEFLRRANRTLLN